VDPAQPVVTVLDSVVLNATPAVDLQGDLEWEVKEPYGGGLLHSQGQRVTYVAPGMAGTYHLVLAATGADGKALRQEVEVKAVPAPQMEPAAPRLAPGETLQFRARMRGLPGDASTWSVVERDGGEITPEGLYTAPSRGGIFHVAATSALDPEAVAQATVTVTER
jgi:hypothetical protein